MSLTPAKRNPTRMMNRGDSNFVLAGASMDPAVKEKPVAILQKPDPTTPRARGEATRKLLEHRTDKPKNTPLQRWLGKPQMSAGEPDAKLAAKKAPDGIPAKHHQELTSKGYVYSHQKSFRGAVGGAMHIYRHPGTGKTAMHHNGKIDYDYTDKL